MRWPKTKTDDETTDRALERNGNGDARSEIAEFAAVLPVLIMMLLAIMSFARAYNVYTTITYAAQEGARTAATSTCATCGNQAAIAQASDRVVQVLQASKIDPTAIQTYSGATTPVGCNGGAVLCPPGSNNVTVCTNVELDDTARRGRRGRTTTTVTGPTACGASVTFQYPFQFNLPFTSLSRQIVTLKADVQLPGEN